jgi:pimeloyl-ACP methyl ester carboxylesterase
MLSNRQIVQIERHEWEDGLVALSFEDAAAATTSQPLVFVLHGLGSRKERHLDLCLRLAKAGFRACALDARLHGERQAAESAVLAADRRSLPFLSVFAQTVQGTVADIATIATELGATRYGVVGHSMGGFIAMATGLADRRATVVVNVSGSLETRVPPEIAHGLPPTALAGIAALNVVARAGEFWPASVLLVHGQADETVSIEGARRLYQALLPFYAEDPARLVLTEFDGVGHEWTPEMAALAVEFLRRL